MPAPGNTGAYFVAVGSGGLLDSLGVIFGPDGNGDGHQDLYVSNTDLHNNGLIKARDGNIRRYDGVTGAFIDTFVPTGSGGLKDPNLIAFTATDPVTLAYTGGNRLTAASLAGVPISQTLPVEITRPLLTEAATRWQAVRPDAASLCNIDIRIADLGGTTLGLASGHTIWLDDNAAGWGWFVDPTPWDASEFTTPGNQGEQSRMDLLTTLAHEIGHLLGHDHEQDGVMADTLGLGVRHMPDTIAWSLDAAIVEWALANKK
jgi:hypothetical protein